MRIGFGMTYMEYSSAASVLFKSESGVGGVSKFPFVMHVEMESFPLAVIRFSEFSLVRSRDFLTLPEGRHKQLVILLKGTLHSM